MARVIQYQSGRLNCLVRFKSDYYLQDKIETEEPERQESATAVSTAPDTSTLSPLQVADSLIITQRVQTGQGDVKVEPKGKKILQSAVH